MRADAFKLVNPELQAALIPKDTQVCVLTAMCRQVSSQRRGRIGDEMSRRRTASQREGLYCYISFTLYNPLLFLRNFNFYFTHRTSSWSAAMPDLSLPLSLVCRLSPGARKRQRWTKGRKKAGDGEPSHRSFRLPSEKFLPCSHLDLFLPPSCPSSLPPSCFHIPRISHPRGNFHGRSGIAFVLEGEHSGLQVVRSGGARSKESPPVDTPSSSLASAALLPPEPRESFVPALGPRNPRGVEVVMRGRRKQRQRGGRSTFKTISVLMDAFICWRAARVASRS